MSAIKCLQNISFNDEYNLGLEEFAFMKMQCITLLKHELNQSLSTIRLV